MTPRQHLETQQALFKQFAEILDFTLKFDDLKVRRRYTNTKKLIEMNPKVGVKAYGLFQCLRDFRFLRISSGKCVISPKALVGKEGRRNRS